MNRSISGPRSKLCPSMSSSISVSAYSPPSLLPAPGVAGPLGHGRSEGHALARFWRRANPMHPAPTHPVRRSRAGPRLRWRCIGPLCPVGPHPHRGCVSFYHNRRHCVRQVEVVPFHEPVHVRIRLLAPCAYVGSIPTSVEVASVPPSSACSRSACYAFSCSQGSCSNGNLLGRLSGARGFGLPAVRRAALVAACNRGFASSRGRLRLPRDPHIGSRVAIALSASRRPPDVPSIGGGEAMGGEVRGTIGTVWHGCGLWICKGENPYVRD